MEKIPVDVGKLQIGPMYPKDSILAPIFDKLMKTLSESGVLSKMEERWLPKLTDEVCGDLEGAPPEPIDFFTVKSLFLILISGMAISVAVASYEKCKKILTTKAEIDCTT